MGDTPEPAPETGTAIEARLNLELAQRLRDLRVQSGLSVRALAARIGTSASFVSQLERGLTGASTSTLMRIADTYGISLSVLFDLQADTPVARHQILRRQDRPALPIIMGCRKTLLSRRPLKDFEIYTAEFEAGGTTGAEPYSHGNASEMLVVLQGRVELTVDGELHLLEAGDSIEYSSASPHRVANHGQDRAEVIFIISPPTSSAGDLERYFVRSSGPA